MSFADNWIDRCLKLRILIQHILYCTMADMLADFELLKKYNIPLLPYHLAKSEGEATGAAKKIGYPVVLKIVSPEIEHKTDVGGVKVGVKTEAALKIAYKELIENANGRKLTGILVQKMARKGVELIIGGKKDEQFGHMVVLGLGGVFVEVFRDITARVCPITETDVREMISELKAHPIITGTRGRKPIHIKSLCEIAIKTCRMMHENNISEIDINPAVFDEKGCDIIDVRVIK